jgi:hypothetical protein
LVFDDTFSVGNKPSSIHKFLGFFPEVHTLTIIWNIQWERHDTRWKSMICRAADEPSLDHITQLEVVFQSHGKGARSLSSNDWQFQYLLSRLDPPHLERLIISDAGTWTAGESVYEMEVCFEKYYGNLAALCGRWLSLRSISVHQVINFDEDQHHSGIYEHLWVSVSYASQSRPFTDTQSTPRQVSCGNSSYPASVPAPEIISASRMSVLKADGTALSARNWNPTRLKRSVPASSMISHRVSPASRNLTAYLTSIWTYACRLNGWIWMMLMAGSRSFGSSIEIIRAISRWIRRGLNL